MIKTLSIPFGGKALAVLLLLVAEHEPLPRIIEGTATVIDGDTLSVAGRRIRLHGIDAPEMGQTCHRSNGEAYACGATAKEFLIEIVDSGIVTCFPKNRDRYGRVVANCTNRDGHDLGRAMVISGWAIAYRRFSTEYANDELFAESRRLGIWAGTFDRPENWRHPFTPRSRASAL